MAAIAGRSGGVSLSAVLQAYPLLIVKSWELDEKCDTVDSTPMVRTADPQAKSFTPTLSEFTISVEGMFDDDDWHFFDRAIDGIDITPGVTAEVELYIDADDDGLAYIADGIVTSVKPSLSVDGVCQWSLEIQGQNGIISYPEDTPP